MVCLTTWQQEVFGPRLLHSVGGCYHYEDIRLEGAGAGPSTVLYLLTSRYRIVVHSKTISPMSDWNEFYGLWEPKSSKWRKSPALTSGGRGQ